MYDAEPLALRLSAVVLCSCGTLLSTSGQQRFCFRTITCTARITVGMRAITCTARITVGMRAITCTAPVGSMKYGSVHGKRLASSKSNVWLVEKQVSGRSKLRGHTLENAGKYQKQRMGKKKTCFEEREITKAYVGKRRHAQNATYG